MKHSRHPNKESGLRIGKGGELHQIVEGEHSSKEFISKFKQTGNGQA